MHLGQLYDFSSGLSKPRSAFGSGYSFLTFKDVFYNIFVPSELGDLVNSTEHERDVCSIKRGDVFLTRTSETMHELGMSCVALQDVDAATFNGFTKRLRPKAGVEIAPEYAGYFFRSDWFRRQITAMASLSTRASLNNEMLGRLQMILPDEIDQRAIGRVLKCLDDKIELNQRMNETLESMARAIFKSWFVDFDPVRAKLRGEQPAGLAPEIAALFPDALVETELGETPEGWKVIGLNETATFLNGLALQKYPPENGDSLPVIKIAQLRKGSTEGADRASAEINEAYVVEDGDVLFSWSGSLECVLWTGGRGALNQHLFKVTSGDYPKWFYHLWIHHHLPSFRRIAAGKATTMGHIQRHHLAEAKVGVPPSTILVHADQVLGPMMDALVSRALESRMLTILRDTLLPKLISGELRVADAERMVGGSI